MHARERARGAHAFALHRDRWRQAVLAFFLRQRRTNSDGFERSAEALDVSDAA
jgi:hypothetical protein